MSLKSILGSIAVAVALIPSVVGAQAAIIDLGDGASLIGAFNQLMNVVNNYAIPFIIALAVIYFLVGVFQFIMNADDDDGRKKGRNRMIYGLIGLAVMLSLWALVAFIQNSFNLRSGGGPRALPGINPPTGSNTGGTGLRGGVGPTEPIR